MIVIIEYELNFIISLKGNKYLSALILLFFRCLNDCVNFSIFMEIKQKERRSD